MTQTSKAPMPPLTRALQVAGMLSAGLGLFLSLATLCESPAACVTTVVGVALFAWGVAAVLSTIRGIVGLVSLLVAITSPLLISWIQPLFGLVFLVIVGGLVKASRDRLAAYYRAPSQEART